MTRKIKSFISLLLCICMFVGTLPNSLIEAFAEETGTQQEAEGESVTAEVSGLGESATEEATEAYLDQSVTVDISAAQVDGNGDALTTALTGETLTAVVSAYNDNPNYEAEATIRIYVKKVTSDSDSEIELKELPDIKVSGAGSSDKASAVTVEAKWYAVDESADITIPYLEFSIPSGASAVFNLELSYPTGYDESATAQIYAEIITTDEETGTETTKLYPSDNSSEYLTFTWTGEANWDNFTKTPSITAIGVVNSVIKADEVDWTFSADNNTTGSEGVVYTKYITMTDTLSLPDGLTVSNGTVAYIPSASSTAINEIKTANPAGKIVVGEVQNGSGEVVYVILLDDVYKDYYTFSMSLVTDSAGNLTGITYTITIDNPDETDVSFNPVSAISTSIYLSTLEVASGADLTGEDMVNKANLTVYTVIKDDSTSRGYKELISKEAESKVSFNTAGELGVSKSVYQVKDGAGNVTYGYDLEKTTVAALSNEKIADDKTPYVAEGYTVTYQVTVSNTYTASTDAEMEDTIPSQLTLDESTIEVTSGDSTLTIAEDYEYEVSTDQTSGETTLTVNVYSVPANGSVVIQYSCTVGTVEENDIITNTATVGSAKSSATVTVPESGAFTITREIIQRTTTTSNGSMLKIYKDLSTNEYKCTAVTGNAIVEYFGISSPSQTELEEAITTVNAGDTIEYLITVDNQSINNVTGVIYDSNLFSTTVSGDTSGYSDASNSITQIVGGWEYYAIGAAYALKSTATGTSTSTSASVTPTSTDLWSLQSQCIYTYSGLETVISGINTTYRGYIWSFSSGSGLAAYTTYRQTTILQIPGDNTKSSASAANTDYQNLVSSYAYYCASAYGETNSWRDFIYFTQTGSTSWYGYDNVYKVERQIYLNTGTLASTVVDSGNVASDGVLKELIGSSTLDANDYENSGRYFTADDNCYVVNYVYLFNDSSEAMNLNDYSVSVVLPEGFEWVGFTYSIGTDSTGTYRQYAGVDSYVELKNYYAGENYDIWVNNTRVQGNSIQKYAYSYSASNGTNESYYTSGGIFPQTVSQMQQYVETDSNILQGYDNVTNDLTCKVDSDNTTASKVTFQFNSKDTPSIAAYQGIVIMYVAKVSDAAKVKATYTGTDAEKDNNAAATFQAYIERKYNTKYTHDVTTAQYCMSQISPVIRAQDAASVTSFGASGYRQKVSNDGNANTILEHKLDYFYTASGSEAGGTAANLKGEGNASRMWSYVSLSMYAETTSVSVTKDVEINNGEDEDGQYSNGETGKIATTGASASYYIFGSTMASINSYIRRYSLLSSIGLYRETYENYTWGYPLDDGIHRTVDGTVTWHTTITNTGEDTSGNDGTTTSPGVVYDYSTVNVSTMLETIDSPYQLVEIAVEALTYYEEGNPTPYQYTWLYYELPEADPEGDMTAAGWIKDGDCYYYETFPRTTNGKMLGEQVDEYDSSGSISISTSMSFVPCIRVTVRCLDEETSLASGYDADKDEADGNQNTCAYQYLIEFADPNAIGNYSYEPLLVTQDEAESNTKLQYQLDLYLTFSTDDSIETNYNSFGLVLKDTSKDDVQVEEGELITAAEVHNLSSSGTTSTSTTSTSFTSTTAGSGSGAGSVASTETVIQANDWTDTSYTDGMKTVTILDEDGDVALDEEGSELSVNSREDGNMVLPSTVEAGTKIHNTLMWESVLYESENYSAIEKLVIYDTYGVQAGASSDENVMSGGYDVDFDSITVKMCLNDEVLANEALGVSSTDDDFTYTYELERGTDYDIYYTTAELVTKEHHPITVNSLELAADLSNLENVTWKLYDPDDSDCDTSEALAFKIVFQSGGKAETIWNYKYDDNSSQVSNLSDWARCEIYVDYDAEVSDSVVEGGKYPNVMAWTADVLYPTTDSGGNAKVVSKSIKEDTTAMFFEVSDVTYPKLTKTVEDESGNVISSQVPKSAEFTYLVFRTDFATHKTTNLTLDDDITGVAAVTIHAGETLTLDDSNLTVLYNDYADGDDSAATFWGAEDAYYYLVEMDSGNYTEESLTIADSTGVTDGNAASMKIGSLTNIATAISDAAATLTSQAELCEAVAAYLEAGATARTAYFMVPADTDDWSVSVAGVNNYTAPTLEICKTDEYGTTIINEVTFQMQDADGTTLYFTETSGGYAYVGTVSTDSTDVTELVFNGTTSVTGLPEGTYSLVETKAPEGYEISAAKTPVTITAGVTKVKVSVANKESSTTVTGSVKLVKVDDSTNKAITTNSASFQLYSDRTDESSIIAFTQDKENGTEVAGSYTYSSSGGTATISTDASTGTLNLSGLPLGTYYLVETSVPVGYESDHTTLATAYEITISRTELEVELDFPNTYIQADIVISKTDEKGTAIIGNPASFTLTDEDKNEVTFSKTSDGIYTYNTSGTVTTLATSSADGTLTLKNLPKGTYTLTETNAPKGYTVSTDPLEITVENSGQQPYTVVNETASMRLRIAKTWKYEGRTATYAFSGVNFTLYQVSSNGNSASEAASGTTNGSGILNLDGLDWSQKYYLYEEVPTGFSASGNLETVYRNDTTGEIDLTVTEATTGYTAISCIYIDTASTLNSTNSSGEEYCTYAGGSWTYTLDVLNVKNGTYGGKYASTAYKTISNAKSAAAHEGLEEQTGYSYFYQQSDYDAGNYNYVNAIQNGDTVTYTLNISNVSETEFTGLVIIDRMPETNDTGVVNSSASRGSEFEVVNPANIVVTVDGVEVSSSLYTISYSTKVKFTNSDFNGTSSWIAAASDSKSFRIVFDSTFTLDPGQTLVVTYDGVIGEDAEIDEIAWNNFAYRYTASSGSKTITLTPEPPKVGVLIQGESYKVTKEWEDNDDSLGLRPSSVTLQLKKKDSNGKLTEVENGTVTLTYAVGTSGTEPTESLTATIADKASGSTVEVKASLDEDGNWVCLWTGLPILDDGYSYVVEEIDTGSTNYVWSVAMEEDENGVESEESAIVTNTLQFTTLNLVKQNSSGDSLSGTEFKLERKTESGTWETVKELYTLESNGSITTTSLTSTMLTTGTDGKITITGLQAGTYRITEVKSQSGYTLLSDPLEIELPVSYTDDEVTSKNIDTTGSDTYQIGDNWYFYNVTYTITNTANFTMPSAGQTADSVWISGFFGALLLAGAWMFLLHRRRANHLINHLPDTP